MREYGTVLYGNAIYASFNGEGLTKAYLIITVASIEFCPSVVAGWLQIV